MDCEKFDDLVIDALYDELDDVTHQAIKRHIDSCARCGAVFAGLHATREVGVLPLEQPSADLEQRILEAALAAQDTAPWYRKVTRAMAWVGSHAMRPQLAMAAVLMLMLGSSLLLLRARPGTVGVAPVRVTERGSPEPEEAEVSDVRAPKAAPAALPPPALDFAPAGARDDAEGSRRSKGDSLEKGDSLDRNAPAALSAARRERGEAGCSTAVGLLDRIATDFAATPEAADAMWEAADCYKSMGQSGKAVALYRALSAIDPYRARAEQELRLALADSDAKPASGALGALASKAATPAARPQASAATTASPGGALGGIGGKGVAAPAPQAPAKGPTK